jgi:hypothetical protein
MAKKKTLLDKRREKYRLVFGSDDGSWVLRDLMMTFHFARGTHIPGDSHESSFREGQRSVALHILGLMAKKIDDRETVKEINHDALEYFPDA